MKSEADGGDVLVFLVPAAHGSVALSSPLRILSALALLYRERANAAASSSCLMSVLYVSDKPQAV